MQIHILTAEHFHVPGLITEAHLNPATATAKAVELANLMLKDTNRKQDATAKNWQAKVEWLQEYHGAAHCYIEIVEHELVGVELDGANGTGDALVKAEEFIEGFEDDETQEGIADILAGLRAAILRERARPDLLALARDYRGSVDFYIRRDLKAGDTEGANMKRLTQDYIDGVIARAEGRANG